MLSFFKTLNGGCITLEYEADITILQLKELLSTKMNLPSQELHIIFCGKECKYDKTADDYKFWTENCAYVIHRKRKKK